MSVGHAIHRMRKLVAAAPKPAFWPALSRGIMPTVEHLQAIKGPRPGTLIDVGAYKGQFSLVARHLFPGIEIHAFEPLESHRRILASLVAPPLTIHATALGSYSGRATFYVTSPSHSSSLLKPGDGQLAAYNVSLENTSALPVSRLGDVLDLSTLARPILMKVDVQGAELEIFRGIGDDIRVIDTIYCEVSFVPLYQDQPLINDIVAFLAEKGFFVRGMFNQSVTDEFGPTQADVLFQRAR